MNWDLTYLFKNHEEWEKALEEVKEAVGKAVSFQGKLHEENSFVEFVKFEEELENKFEKVYQYASLKSDLNKKDISGQVDLGKVMGVLNMFNTSMSFVSPEMLGVGKDKIMKFIENNKEINFYKFIAEKLFHMNEHVLDNEQEKILSYYGPLEDAGRNLYSSLAVADNVNDKITLSNGKEVVVSQGSWRSLIEDSKDANDRKNIFEAIFKKYEANKNTYASAYEAVMNADNASRKARKFDSILDAHLFGNNIPTTVFKNLVEVASTNNESLKKYYKLKEKYLKLEKFHTYDRFMQLAYSDKKYSYEQAKELFFDSIKNCPQDFIDKAHDVLKDGFVDVYEKEGKRSGAYSSGIAGNHPFILLNFSSTLDDVFTLAHESGHSIHTLYAQEAQPNKLQDYTIFVAEIASTFNEHMLLDYLMGLDSITKEEKIMLLQKSIDDICSTFYRQTLFANYEYKVSKKVENNEPINHEVLSNIMIDLYQKYYGLDIKEEVYKQYVWAYIPHLFYTPFYVYQYATSFSASFALYQNVCDKVPGAFEKYTNLLKSGGSKYPMEQTLEAGIDFNNKETFLAVTRRMDYLVNELEKLLEA